MESAPTYLRIRDPKRPLVLKVDGLDVSDLKIAMANKIFSSAAQWVGLNISIEKSDGPPDI